MSGLTSARSNRGGSRGTRMTARRYYFNARDGMPHFISIEKMSKRNRCGFCESETWTFVFGKCWTPPCVLMHSKKINLAYSDWTNLLPNRTFSRLEKNREVCVVLQVYHIEKSWDLKASWWCEQEIKSLTRLN